MCSRKFLFGLSHSSAMFATLLFLLVSADAFSNNPLAAQQQQVCVQCLPFFTWSHAIVQSANLPPLSGLVDDCCCSVSDTQHVNDNYIARALDVVANKRFFRFFKVNLDKECPFWAVQSTCGKNGGCEVCHCNADEIPVSWRQAASDAVTRGGIEQWKDDDKDMWLSPEEGSTSYVDLTKNRCMPSLLFAMTTCNELTVCLATAGKRTPVMSALRSAILPHVLRRGARFSNSMYRACENLVVSLLSLRRRECGLPSTKKTASQPTPRNCFAIVTCCMCNAFAKVL